MITKAEFKRYEVVRSTGLYNMFMDAKKVAILANLSGPKLKEIMLNYSSLSKKFKSNNNDVRLKAINIRKKAAKIKNEYKAKLLALDTNI